MAINVVRVGEYPAPHLSNVYRFPPEQSPSLVDDVYHVSVDQSGEHLYISNERGTIQKVSTRVTAEEDLLQIQTSGEKEGYHTATEDGGLIYADKANRVIYRMHPDRSRSLFTRTEDWEPLSVHSSRINGDILVGMKKQGEAKITRYDMTGEEQQNIQKNNHGQEMYIHPGYITENTKGDICTSDMGKRAVVMVDRSGQYLRSYPGDGSKFRPFGICTDRSGHILVSDSESQSVHVLDQSASFLTSILSPQEDLRPVFGICVADTNNHIYAGQPNLVIMYRYT